MYYAQHTIPNDVQRRYLPIKKTRIWELDFLRGACVILMILDHLALLVEYFAYSWYGRGWYSAGRGDAMSRFCYWWSGSLDRTIAHNVVLVVFFAISGISCYFSRSNFKRGLQLALVAVIYTLVTVFDEYVLGITDEMVIFGVLHFLAVSILIYALVDFACRHNKRAIMVCSVGIIGIVLVLFFCYTPPENTPMFFAFIFPPRENSIGGNSFYSQSEFSPGDLFTMVPYLAHFFLGVFLGPILYDRRRSLLPQLNGKWHYPVSFIGRHALICYLLHILVIGAILALVSYFFMTPGNFGL